MKNSIVRVQGQSVIQDFIEKDESYSVFGNERKEEGVT